MCGVHTTDQGSEGAACVGGIACIAGGHILLLHLHSAPLLRGKGECGLCRCEYKAQPYQHRQSATCVTHLLKSLIHTVRIGLAILG